MAARNLYPSPECPRCGKSINRVKNTYYTDDGRICRTRQCDFCEWKWWTLQYPEIQHRSRHHAGADRALGEINRL